VLLLLFFGEAEMLACLSWLFKLSRKKRANKRRSSGCGYFRSKRSNRLNCESSLINSFHPAPGTLARNHKFNEAVPEFVCLIDEKRVSRMLNGEQVQDVLMSVAAILACAIVQTQKKLIAINWFLHKQKFSLEFTHQNWHGT
jgi:hypothetical protein